MTDIFFGGPDDENFHAKTPAEYIIDKFDGGVLDVVLADLVDGVVVVEYHRKQVGHLWLERQAERLLEAFDEQFDEEYSYDDTCVRGDADIATVSRELTDLLTRHVARNMRVYWCEEVARRTYTRDEVLAVLGEKPTSAPAPAPVEVLTFKKPEVAGG